MNSTGVYDSDNASDSESWSTSEDEQVIEISSHSRILISPRKTRSAWNINSQGKSKKIVSASKMKAPRVQNDQDISKISTSRSQTRRRSNQNRNPKSGWIGSPRKSRVDNQSVRSNNNSISESESDQDDSSGSDNNGDSDVSFEENIDSAVHRRVSRNHTKTSTSHKHSSKSLDDTMGSLGSPTTPGKEMEELKATLKKLAHHEDSDKNPILQNEPKISSATVLHEYLTAATAVNAMNAANQTRPIEQTGTNARQSSSQANSYVSRGSMKTKPKSMQERENDTKNSLKKLADRSGNPIGVESERLTFDKKIFSTPPPPFGAFPPGLSLPLHKTSGVGTNGGGAQGSRAVLSALKALQDKIGRLEEERESLKQQLSDTKLIARKREAELASSEKKFSYELGQTKDSARAAYDALRCDHEELKIQLVKSEERRKATQTERQHYQELTKNLSTKADDLQSQLEISESHRTRLKTEIKESEKNHKRAVDDLQAELTQTHQELQTAVERNELLEAQFQRESTNHAESRERLKDSEQTMASMSQLNEKLVAKVLEATEAVNQVMKKNKKLQQQIRPSTLLKPTAASRANAAAASNGVSRRTANTSVPPGGSVISPAKTVKKKKSSAGAGSTAMKKPKKTKGLNNMTLLREANLGKDIPFLLGNSVQPSFSLIGNIQDALRRCDTTYVMPTLLGDTIPEIPPSHPQTAKKNNNSPLNETRTNNPQENADVARSVSPAHEDTTTTTAFSQSPTSPADAEYNNKSMPPAIKVPRVSPKMYASSMQSGIMEDLHAAVESAEKEFKQLTKRYKDLVVQMEANNRKAAGSGSDQANKSTSAQLSQALGPLLDELEAKAKQMNLLKQVYQQASTSTINPQRHSVVSPAAIRRKTASLRVLNEYRQLEDSFKNKGSGRSSTPSHIAGDTSFH